MLLPFPRDMPWAGGGICRPEAGTGRHAAGGQPLERLRGLPQPPGRACTRISSQDETGRVPGCIADRATLHNVHYRHSGERARPLGGHGVRGRNGGCARGGRDDQVSDTGGVVGHGHVAASGERAGPGAWRQFTEVA